MVEQPKTLFVFYDYCMLTRVKRFRGLNKTLMNIEFNGTKIAENIEQNHQVRKFMTTYMTKANGAHMGMLVSLQALLNERNCPSQFPFNILLLKNLKIRGCVHQEYFNSFLNKYQDQYDFQSRNNVWEVEK